MALRPVQVEDAIGEYFDGLVKQRATAQVGLLIGKPVVGSRSLLLAVVPSPEQEGQPAVTITGGAASASGGGAKGKKGGGGGGGSGVGVQLESDWIAEHARQVSRMLPGGLEVLGLYLLAPDAAWGAAAGQLCAALATMSVDARAVVGPSGSSIEQLLLLHIDATTRKLTARGCAAAPAPAPAALRLVELRAGSAAGSLVRLTARHSVDATLPATAAAAGSGGKPRAPGGGAGGGQQLQRLAEALIASEAARLAAAVATVGGALPAEGAALGDVLPPEAPGGDTRIPAAEAQLYCTLPAASPMDSAEDATAAPVSTAAAPLHGSCTLRGEVVGVAYVHRREPAARALAELRADVVKSLRARLDLLTEEALAAADEAEAAAEQREQQGQGQQKAAAAPHPLLAATDAGRAAHLALPRRVLLPWRVAGGAELRACDYLAEGEGREEAAARAQELLGLSEEEAPASAVEELEAPAVSAGAAATRKGAAPARVQGSGAAAGAGLGGKRGGDGEACSGTAVAGLAAGAAALLAVVVGYMSMGSS